jgi:hypothetical protein
MSQKRLEMGEEAWAEYQRQRKLKKAQGWLLCCRCHAEIHDELYLESKQVTIDKLKNMAR